MMDKTTQYNGARSDSITKALDRIRILLENLPGQDHEKNKSLVRAYFRAIDAGDPAALDQFVSADYVDHNPQFPNLPSGIDGVRQGFIISLSAWANVHHEILDQIAEDDKVVSRINAYGIHIGEFLGVPATHKEITMSGITVHRIAKGKLVEHWSNIDQVGVLVQLGVLPPPGPSPNAKRSSRLTGGRAKP